MSRNVQIQLRDSLQDTEKTAELMPLVQVPINSSPMNAHEKLNFKVKISDLNNSWKNVSNNEGKSDAELDKHHAMVRQFRRLNKTLIIERFDLQEQY